MRQLNKIVLINSANIGYSEIRLDGNTCLNGNQGAGKSTILRAILFFYTGQTRKGLGIDKEKKPFMEYYFDSTCSYIVYEVMRDEFTYSVVVYRNGNTLSFRFVDAAYDSRWFIGEDGMVQEWPAVLKHIGGIHVSPCVSTLEQYRSIIYGNVGKGQFSQYCLFSGQNYQCIPSAIQSVFLNDKIDADFIKNSLVDSLSENPHQIDLSSYRSKLSAFGKDLEDIKTWYRQRNREYIVQREAERLIGHYRNVIALGIQVVELWKELNYAIPADEQRTCELEVEGLRLLGLSQELTKEKAALTADYTSLSAKLHDSLSRVKAQLDECQSRRAKYRSLRIEEFLPLFAQEKELRQRLAQQEEMLTALQHEVDDIRSHFEGVEKLRRAQLSDYINQRNAEKNGFTGRYYKNKEAIFNEMTSLKEEIQKSKDDIIESLRHTQETQLSDLAELESDRKMNEVMPLFRHEIEAAEASIRKYMDRKRELEASEVGKEGEMKTLRMQLDFELNALSQGHEGRKSRLQQEIQTLREQHAEVQALVDNWKGTFSYWLEENLPDWQDSIGRVADEKILLSSSLDPILASGSDLGSFFGVQINLCAIEPHPVSQQELMLRKERLEEGLQKKIKEYESEEVAYKDGEDRLRKEFVSRINTLQQEVSNLSITIDQTAEKIKTACGEKESYIQKAAKEREEKIARILEKMTALRSEKAETEKSLSRTKAEKETALKAVADNAREKQRHAEQEMREAVQAIESQIKEETEAAERECAAILRDLDKAYLQKGVDAVRISQQKRIIDELKRKITIIDDNRNLVAVYYSDKERYFDREEDLRLQKKTLLEQIASHEQTYSRQLSAKTQALKDVERQRSEAEGKKKALEESLAESRRFHAEDGRISDEIRAICEKMETDRSSRQVYMDLSQNRAKAYNEMESLKKSVNAFKSNFAPDNTFKFPAVVTTDEEFLDYGLNISNFVAFNKVNDFVKTLNNHYLSVLSCISRDGGFLAKEESAIESLILDINRDFSTRNFLKALDSIRIRKSPVDTPLMSLLRALKKFYDNNQEHLGELNLFNSDYEGTSKINMEAIDHLNEFYALIQRFPEKKELTIKDVVQLEFRIVENGNDTNWRTSLRNVGSNGTDTCIKIMINITMMYVFRNRVNHKQGDFRFHCIVDEIGTIFPENIRCLMQYASDHGILLVNGAPISNNMAEYKYLYSVSKNEEHVTRTALILTNRNIESNG